MTPLSRRLNQTESYPLIGSLFVAISTANLHFEYVSVLTYQLDPSFPS
jgi:hypothetical protein